MPDKLITYERARREVKRLQKYVSLIENYETDTLDKWIIKEYAITNSIKQIIDTAEEEKITQDGRSLERGYVTDLINGPKIDELHRILRLGYRRKIRPNKRKW